MAGDVANFSETTKSWNILTTSGGITGFNKDYWNIITTTGGITEFNASEWQIVKTGFLDVEGGSWSISQSVDNKNLVLNYTVVPEPGAALIGSLGLLALLRRRR